MARLGRTYIPWRRRGKVIVTAGIPRYTRSHTTDVFKRSFKRVVHIGSQSLDVHTNTQTDTDGVISALTTAIPSLTYVVVAPYFDYGSGSANDQFAKWATSIHNAGKKMWIRSPGFNDWVGLNGATQYSSTRTNLLMNPGFETNDLYTGIGGTATKATDSTTAYFGNQSLRMTGSAIDDRVYYTLADGGALTIGQQYTFSAYLKGSGTVRLWIYNGSVDSFTSNITLTSTWTRYSITFTAQATTGLFGGVRQNASGALVANIDATLLEVGSTLGDFFNGDNFGSWTGTAGNSTSTQIFHEWHRSKMYKWIGDNYAIFQAGDVFEPLPDEPENNSLWNTTYTTIGSGAGQTAYNGFITKSIAEANARLVSLGVTNVDTGYVGMNPSAAKDVVTQTTADILSALLTDDYPENSTTTPATMAAAMQSEVNTWILPNKPTNYKHVTFGPNVYTQLTQQDQADTIGMEMAIIQNTLGRKLDGMTVWQFGATDNNPKSRLFDWSGSAWVARSATATVEAVFKQGFINNTGYTRDHTTDVLKRKATTKFHTTDVYKYASASNFKDNFNDNSIAAAWTTSLSANGAEVLEQNSRMEISHANIVEYNTLSTVNSYSLTGDYISIKLTNAGNQALVSHEVIFGLQKDTSNKLFFDISGGTIFAFKQVAGVSTQLTSATYSGTTHLYLRIRESGGTTFFDYSANGTSWTNFTSLTNPFAITLITPFLQVGAWQAEATGSFAYFDDYNIGATPSFTRTHTTDTLKRKANTKTHTTDVYKRGGNWTSKIMAWFYPGVPATNANVEYSDGRRIHFLKPEYQTVNVSGAIIIKDAATYGIGGYTQANAQDVVAKSDYAFYTISGAQANTSLLLSTSGNRSAAVTAIMNFLNQLKVTDTAPFDGVELDWEGYSAWTTTDYANYKTFVTSLATTLHAAGYKLMIDGPPIGDTTQQSFYLWKYEDFNSLQVDYIVAMAYDNQYDYGGGASISPNLFVQNICDWMKAKITDVDRIVIGMPSYGYHAATGGFSITIDTKAQSAAKTGYGTATRNSDYEMHWTNAGIEYFYQDSQSLDSKRDLIEAKGIKNISVWHLGGNDWFASKSEGVTLAMRKHTTDVYKINRFTRTHTTDVLKHLTPTKTHTTDTLKRKLTLRQFTTDTYLRKVVLKTHTTDVLKRANIIRTHTTDTLKRAINLRTFTTDVFKYRRQLLTFTTDTLKRAAVSKIHTTDTLKRKVNTRTHTTDTNKRAVTIRTFTTDILMRKGGVRTHTSDTLKRGQYLRSHTTDVLKYARLIRTHTTDTYLRQSFFKQHTTDTNKRKVTLRSHTTDVLKRATLTRAHTTDTLKRSINTRQHTTDFFGFRRPSRTHTTDVLRRKVTLRTHTTDVLKRAITIRQHTADTFKRAQLIRSHTTDILKRANLLRVHTTDTLKRKAATLSHTTNTLKRQVTLRTHTTDLLKRGQYVRTHTTDVLKRKVNTRLHTTDVLRRGQYVRSHTTDIFSYRRFSRVHTTDVFRYRRQTVAHTTDTLKRKINLRSHTTDMYALLKHQVSHTTDLLKRGRYNLTHTADTLKRKITLRSHTTDVLKKLVFSRTHTSDTLLRARKTVQHTTDVMKTKRALRTYTTDTLKRQGFFRQHTTDIYLLRRYTTSHTTDVYKRDRAYYSDKPQIKDMHPVARAPRMRVDSHLPPQYKMSSAPKIYIAPAPVVDQPQTDSSKPRLQH